MRSARLSAERRFFVIVVIFVNVVVARRAAAQTFTQRGFLDGSALQWMYELHDNLLLGKKGLVANGWGALLLVVLCISGLVIWWPGVKRIVTGFHFHPRAGWKTQNYDIHKVLGFLSLVPLRMPVVRYATA